MPNPLHRFLSIASAITKRLPVLPRLRWFHDRSIGLKIGLGFGIILLFFLFAGIITYRTLQSASDGFVEYRTIAGSTNLLAKVQTDLLSIRDNVKDYMITGSDEALRSYDSHITVTRARLASTKAAINDPQSIARLADTENKLAQYNEIFQQIVALHKKRLHLVDDVIYVHGPAMSDQLNDLFQRAQGTANADVLFQLGNALKYLNTGRLYASRFLDTGNAEHANTADSEFFLFEDYLYALSMILDDYSLTVLKGINTSLTLYKDALVQAVDTVQRQDILATELIDTIGPEIAGNIGDLTDSIRVRQDSLGPKLVARNASANTVVEVLLIAALLIGTLIAMYLARNITLPLRRATKVMESIRLGRLSDRVGLEQKDEVGRLSRAVDDFADTLTGFSGLLRRMGQGDFALQVPLQSAEDEMGKAARQMVAGVCTLAQGARTAAERVHTGASEMLDASQNLSQAATQQAASVEEITSTMQEIGSQARANADNAALAHALGQEAEQAAKTGTEEMGNLVNAMQELSESSKSIAKVIKVIDEIAFQTNLLALNAAIEAARAGKHGRSFAVVANEVRNLASRSAKAAEETESMIDTALDKVMQGTKRANRTAEALDEIVELGHRSALLVGEIAAASEEQARGAAEVGIALDQVQGVTQENTAQAEEVAAAATELSSQSTGLRQLIGRFRIGDGPMEHYDTRNTEPMPEESCSQEIASACIIPASARAAEEKAEWGQEEAPCVPEDMAAEEASPPHMAENSPDAEELPLISQPEAVFPLTADGAPDTCLVTGATRSEQTLEVVSPDTEKDDAAMPIQAQHTETTDKIVHDMAEAMQKRSAPTQENGLQIPADEFISPEHVIVLDDEEFGRY